MTKFSPIILLVFAVACKEYKKQEPAPVYDQAALKEFVLNTADPDKVKSLHLLDSVLANAAQDSAVFFQTIAYLEKPFGDPNSAYRNEDLYAGILQAKIKSVWLDSAAKSRTREKLYLLMQNRPGSLANDFEYVTPDGSKRRMNGVKTDYVLLYFYNPECEACKEMKTALISSGVINAKVKSGELKILAVYTDKDEKTWLNHLNEMPKEWIQGRDEEEYLNKNKVYDLRAIPTVYLLDREKKVLLKDCVSIKEIEMGLNNQQIKKVVTQ